MNFSTFPSLNKGMIEDLERVLSKDVPKLMECLASERDTADVARAKMESHSHGDGVNNRSPTVPLDIGRNKFGGSSSSSYDSEKSSNPFTEIDSSSASFWSLQEEFDRFHRDKFESLGPSGGFLSNRASYTYLLETGLEKDELRRIWEMSDIDRDGQLDSEEFAVAMFLVDALLSSGQLPDELEEHEIPPSKRSSQSDQGAQPRSLRASTGRSSNGGGGGSGGDGGGKRGQQVVTASAREMVRVREGERRR